MKFDLAVMKFDLSVILSVKLEFFNSSTVKLVEIEKFFLLFFDKFGSDGGGAGALIQFDVTKVGAIVGSSGRVQSLDENENDDENFHIFRSISVKIVVIVINGLSKMAAADELKFQTFNEISRNKVVEASAS